MDKEFEMSVEEFENLPKFPPGWPLIEYLQKRFGSKKGFLSFMAEKSGIKLPKTRPYFSIIDEIDKKIGKDKLLFLLGIEDEEEAEVRVYLYRALYDGLLIPSLSSLYERLMGEKIRIRRNIEKRAPAHKLAFYTDEDSFKKVWVVLWKEGKLPATLHYRGITIGALGWLPSIHERWGEIDQYYSTIIDIIGQKFDHKSQSVIYGNLLDVIRQIGSEPEKFDVPKDLGEKVINCLQIVKAENEDDTRSAMGLQLIHVFFDDESLINIINELITRGYVGPPKVQGLYERFPYSFSDWVITPYGLIKQPASWLRKPAEKLAKLLQERIEQRFLEPDLEKYHGDYALRVLEYCIKEDPKNIMEKWFGLKDLQKIVEELGISAALKVRKKDELIGLILLQLGFNLPPTLTGLKDFTEFLNQRIRRLEKDEPPSDIMPAICERTEGLLRDIAYFYTCFLYAPSIRWEPKDLLKELNSVVKNLNVSGKDFLSLTLGEFIKLVRTSNKALRRNGDLKRKFVESFDRDYILSEDQMKILDKTSPLLATFKHPPKPGESRPDRKACLDIISNLKKFIESVKSVYPKVIRITREITNEYGTRCLEAIDDQSTEWTIEYRWLDPSKPYFMHSKTNPVAIDPVIIEKIF